ncbi:hypothetical protein CYL31_10330 [Marinomonas sp. A3A]|jgi:hypothetical protein|uniref:DUF2589 domain-containing protein n=1 Tax=Marinomonas TaxID=28253 RepID=UPI001BB410E8|nr:MULTISPECIES: DUF2589 domain-containing protein [Marinomonas]QUX91792.1 hypothetical protein CYL31_10330 [Marinomonas sp. A3A]
MIEFQALMRAIHKSVKDAAKSVEGETIDFIKRFFDEEERNDPKDPHNTEPVLRPKTCSMEFPSRTADGIENVTAEIPILALCPISSPRITEVKFSTELEVTTNTDGKLMVSFPDPNKKKSLLGGKGEKQESSNTRIEITLTGSEPPEGLKRLIEGYERTLRAQIPG